MAAIADRRVAVLRLRIRGGGADPLALRLGVDRLLAAAELRPAGLPPAAILVVRSLADPLPGRLDRRAVVPAAGWQQAVASALDDRAARAARPARGPVPGDAEAVLFADRSELLACLGRAWCDGSLAVSWWWRALGLATPRAALQAFAETPEAVPAALARLAADGAATTFAARLQPAEAAALARAVGGAWGAAAAAEAALADGERGAAPAEAAPRAPWHDVPALAERVAALAPEQEALLGVALALWRRPAVVRAPAFAAAARAWRAARSTAPAHPPRRPELVTTATRDAGPAAAEGASPAVFATPEPPRAAARAPAAMRSPAAVARPPAAIRGRADAIRSAHGPDDDTAAGSPGAVAREPGVPEASPAEGDAPAEPLATTLRTELGGLFHLVRVGQLLGLYGDFTTPGERGIALPLWDFVALLGRRLLVRPPRDPVWALVAELAGRRPDEPPGRGYRPPRAWRVPRDWVEPFPEGGTWRCARGTNRLLLRHPAGFAVVDAAGADLGRELRRYGVPASARVRTIGASARREFIGGASRHRVIAARGHASAARERWLGHVAAYVRARLALALDVAPRAAPRIALRRPALVYVTATSVDVVSQLADLPIEVRLAGLDRDPGYVPAAGRSLRFHFE